MMTFLRSQSQTVLVLIIIVIGVSFLFYGNVGSLVTGSGGRGNDFGRIDGQDLSVAELYDAVRAARTAVILSGQPDQLSQPGARAAIAREAWNRLLLAHEADRLHVQVSDQEVVDYIQRQPLFQKNGVYNPDLYQQQMTEMNNRLHINSDQFVTFVREKLQLGAVSDALLSTVRTSVKDVSGEYQKFEGSTQVSVVTIDPKTLAPTMQVTPDEIQAEYKAHPDNSDYRTPEKRKVDFVLMPLTAEQAKLPDKEKAAAIEALGEKALDFALAFQPDPSSPSAHPSTPPDFSAEASKRGLAISTTDFFAADVPPAGVPPSPAFNNAAFALTKDNPVSKVVELSDGVAVLHLKDVQPSELKPLDQVKAGITKQLQQSHAVQQAQTMAQITAQVLKSAVARGTDFKTAAAAQKLTVQTLPPFVPAKIAQDDMRQKMIAYVTMQLKPGEVSQAVPSEGDNSIMIIHLDKRDPADLAGFGDFETRYRERQDEQIRDYVYQDWSTWMSHRPGTHPPPDLDQYGGVE